MIHALQSAASALWDLLVSQPMHGEPPAQTGRIIFDENGCPSLNLEHPEVQAEMRRHIQALAKIKVPQEIGL